MPHAVPPWLCGEAAYLLTVCCRPRDVDHLCRSGRGHIVLASVRFRDDKADWRAIAAVVMPDHVHLLAWFSASQDIARIVRDWKRYLSTTAGIPWQRDFHEHRVRGDHLLPEKIEYLRQNPVRAGLVRSPDDWPFLWIP